MNIGGLRVLPQTVSHWWSLSSGHRGELGKSSVEELAHLAIEKGDLSRVQFTTASVEDMTAMCLHMG